MPVVQGDQYAMYGGLNPMQRGLLRAGMRGGGGSQPSTMRMPATPGAVPSYTGPGAGFANFGSTIRGIAQERRTQGALQDLQTQYARAVQDFQAALPQAGNDPRRALLMAFSQNPEHFTNAGVFQQLIVNAKDLATPHTKAMNVAPGGTLVNPDTGETIFQSPNRPVDVRPGGSLIDPNTGKVIASVPSAEKKDKTWTVDDARLLQGTSTILDNIDSLKNNAGATGPVSGKLKELSAKYLGVGDEAKAYEGSLDTIRSQITGLAGNARYKAQLENLLTTLPTQGQSEDYNRTQSIPNLQLQARQFYADRIAEMQQSGKAIPQNFLDAAKRYNATPDYMTQLQGAISRARNGQTNAGDLKILAGEASSARSPNGDTVYTGNIPFDVVQSGLQSARKQGLIDDARWGKLVQAFPDIANAQQQPAAAPAPGQ